MARSLRPSSGVRREVPAHAALGGRLIAGRVDVLVDDGRRFAVVDHRNLADLTVLALESQFEPSQLVQPLFARVDLLRQDEQAKV